MTQRTGSDNPLTGLRVAITGGTSGLGLATVNAFASRGADVAFVARTRDAVERLAAEQARVHGIVGDVSKKDDIHRIAMEIHGALGGVDVLINNASTLGPTPLSLLADTECEDFDLALHTNVLGPFRLTRALLGALAVSAREGAGAVVINISSDAATQPYPSWGAYGASKAALLHMTRIWHEELAAEDISVMAFDPGDMDTPLHVAAIPEADRATLKRPEHAAAELVELVVDALTTRRASPDSWNRSR